MCGFVAVFEYGASVGAVREPLLTTLRDTLIHRGPDGAGLWISPDQRVGLAHRRLAIIDPEGGHQPMFGPTGTVLVFNGEIYNYPELRRSLSATGVVFRTRCDTEVILHLYDRYGTGCVDHLNGMFAFVLWDPSREQLFVARDRIGEKPVYWHDDRGRFLVGSEAKALLAHPAVTAEVDRAMIGPYLANLVVPAPDSLFRGIGKLAAGTTMTCTRDGLKVHRYWNPRRTRAVHQISGSAAASEVRAKLGASVTARLMADVPVGVLLSGGVDSSSLVALLDERAVGTATFSVGFANSPLDERDEARKVAQHYGTDHYDVEVSEADATGFLASLVHHQDEPLADPVCVPLHFVCRLAANHGIKVVLAGEGADELFWGYSAYSRFMHRRHAYTALMHLPRAARAAAARLIPADRMPRHQDFADSIAVGRLNALHAPLGLSAGSRRAVTGRCDTGLGWAPGPIGPGESLVETVMFDTQEYEFSLRLPELLLMRIDRFSMANSIEARVPFLDPDLMDFGYHLPLSQKIDGARTKVALKAGLRGLVPDEVLDRRKQGFGAPIGQWLGSTMGTLLERLLPTDSVRPYFDIDELGRTLAVHRAGQRDRAFVLWPVLNFALWHRHWIEGAAIDDLTVEVMATR